MLRNFTAGFAGLALLSLSGPAMAQLIGQVTNESYGVQVNIDIAPTVSIWAPASETVITLVLDGTNGPENYDMFQSSLTHINNVAANVHLDVDHTGGPALPADLVYWVFRNMNAATALPLLQAGAANNPGAGVFRYSGAAVNTGVSNVLFASLAMSTNAATFPVVYAADLRNSLPPAQDSETIVTYTISPQ